MITDDLILFCGGPSIYGGVPKPLQKLRTGHTLIEHYLSHRKERSKNTTLIVDQSFENIFITDRVNRLSSQDQATFE